MDIVEEEHARQAQHESRPQRQDGGDGHEAEHRPWCLDGSEQALANLSCALILFDDRIAAQQHRRDERDEPPADAHVHREAVGFDHLHAVAHQHAWQEASDERAEHRRQRAESRADAEQVDAFPRFGVFGHERYLRHVVQRAEAGGDGRDGEDGRAVGGHDEDE